MTISRTKVLKIFLLLFGILLCGGSLYYLQLNNRHKAIVKTTLAHSLRLIDNSWNINYQNNKTSFTSPALFVDNIYTSMEGPKVMQAFKMDPSRDDLIWLTGFSNQVLANDETTALSLDFMCHSNVDFYDASYYSKWNLPNTMGRQYPRLATLTNGMEQYDYPKGYGFPIKTSEFMFLSTQALNHNIKSSMFTVKHKLSISFREDSVGIKPLAPKTIFIMLPYNAETPFNNPAATMDPTVCIPVETKNHSYTNATGQNLSGHWLIFPGKQRYSYNITQQLQLKDTTKLHHIATHLHPYATSLSLVNTTTNTVIFKAIAKNYTDRVGLKKIAEFSSEVGVDLIPNNSYELVLTTNNTSGKTQDMMASMFLGLYDPKLDSTITANRTVKTAL